MEIAQKKIAKKAQISRQLKDLRRFAEEQLKEIDRIAEKSREPFSDTDENIINATSRDITVQKTDEKNNTSYITFPRAKKELWLETKDEVKIFGSVNGVVAHGPVQHTGVKNLESVLPFTTLIVSTRVGEYIEKNFEYLTIPKSVHVYSPDTNPGQVVRSAKGNIQYVKALLLHHRGER
jgi:hypothetical protein